MSFRSISSMLYYDTAILSHRDRMLPRAVHPNGSDIQKQRKQEWMQIKEYLQETDLQAANSLNTQVLEVTRRPTWSTQLLQRTGISAPDRQLLLLLQAICALFSRFQLQMLHFLELDILIIQHILENQFIVTLIDTANELVPAFRLVERVNIGESFGRSLKQIQNQRQQDFSRLYQTQKRKTKKKIKVLPFGIIQESDTGMIIDQTLKETARIFKPVSPWPPTQPVPETSSVTIVQDFSQRQIGGPTPQLVRTPDSWKSNKTSSPKQQQEQLTPPQSTSDQHLPHSCEITSSNIIPVPTPSVQQVQQEQGHLLHPPVAVPPSPINYANIELRPVVDAFPDNTTQPMNNIVIPQLQAQNQQQLVNQQQQLFNLQSQQFTNQQYRLPDPPDSWASITMQPVRMDLRAQQEAQRFHNERILQENRARNEYRIHMHQRAQNKAQQFLMDGMLMNLEARSKGFDNLSYNPFANFQPNFNPNQYIDNLSQIPSQDQQEYSNNFDQYQMQRDDDHDSNDDVFREVNLKQLHVRDHRGRGKKNRGR
ncbi:MAG: hypothetical protein EZS28_022150, partial [Streblomastix strix]